MIAVSIADSFSSKEIQVRLEIAKTKLIFTQDIISRGGKVIPLYTRVIGALPARCVVLPSNEASGLTGISLRKVFNLNLALMC